MHRHFVNLALLLFLACYSVNDGAQQQDQISLPARKLWMDKSLTPNQRAALLLVQMTLDEEISMIHGADWEHNIWVNNSATPSPTSIIPGAAGYIPGIPRLGIPAIQMVDAAVGVTRGSANGRYSTDLPSGLAEASAWSDALSYGYGALIGRELRDAGFNMSLGGGCNLSRDPRNGRNFEYKGEDPILSGRLTGSAVLGLQAQGVIGNVKHLVLNDQETQRTTLNAVVDERSLRETDLLAFEIAVREGHPGGVMCSYNRVNGTYACENSHLLNELLKQRLGFDGFVVSDWKATHSTDAALAGLDVEMPDGAFFDAKLKREILSGRVPKARLDDMVRRVLRSEFAAGLFDHLQHPQVPNIFEGLRFAQRVSEEGSVLLKNERHLLPLDPHKIKSVVLIGGHADVGVLSGGGSAQVDPPGGNAVLEPVGRAPVYFPSSPLRSLRDALSGINIQYVDGSDIPKAVEAARNADIAIIFGVQPAREDTDVEDLALPGEQNRLIEAVSETNRNTLVVLETGGPVTMPWLNRVSAVVEIWYPGIRGAEALSNLLLGKVNPSGKLPLTFPRTEQDLPHPLALRQTASHASVIYSEGLEVGYKWYQAQKKSPLFPFGYGLSYSRFIYSDLRILNTPLAVNFTLKNSSETAGTEISEVYASLPVHSGEPPERLVAWEKTTLMPGESKRMQIPIDPFFLSIFDTKTQNWITLPGQHTFHVGSSSSDTPLNATVQLPAPR